MGKPGKVNLGKVLAGLGIVAVLLLLAGFVGIMIGSQKEAAKGSLQEADQPAEDIRDLRQSRESLADQEKTKALEAAEAIRQARER